MLFKIGVLKNFAIFSDLQPSNFIKERIRHRIFPVNNAKFLRKHFFFQNASCGCFYMWSGPKLVQCCLSRIWTTLTWLWTVGQHCQKQPFADVFKISVLKNFANFILKHLWWSFLLKKVAALKARNFIKKKLQHRCFPVYIAKFLRTPLFYRIPLVAVSTLYRLLFMQSWSKQTKTKFCRFFSFKIIAASSGSILCK